MPKRLIEAAMWVLLCGSLGALLPAAGAYAPAWVPIGGSFWVLGVGAWLALRLGGLLLLLRGPAVAQAVLEASLRGATRRLAADLAPLLERDPLTVETYPGEVYPPDLAVLGAGLAAAARAEGRGAPPRLEPWLRRWSDAIDPTSGLLVQALVPGERAGGDRPRGSGTALAAAALAEADPALARRLGAALQDRWVGPFAAVREVAVGEPPKADIDSGPVLFGVGVSATGFGLDAARAAGQPAAYRGRLRTALLFGGLPRDVGPLSLGFVSGGALGNALLLAMVTTPGCDPVVDSRPAGR